MDFYDEIVFIQSYWRMLIVRKLYKENLSRIQCERKRTLRHIEETNTFVNRNLLVNRHEFLNFANDVIFQNFPGISLEAPKFFGRRPNESIVIKARKDSIGRSCPLSLRLHSSNSIFFVLNPTKQSVKVKCYKCEGALELHKSSRILDEMKDKIVISEKDCGNKQIKTNKYKPVPSFEEIKIIKFDHNAINLSDDVIMQFYDQHKFTYVAAKLDKKCPSFSSWNKRTYDENEPINFRYNNIAIVSGKVSGIFIVDIDIRDRGLTWWQQLCSKYDYYYPQATTCIKTPSGGIHLYYRYVEEFSNNRVKMQSSSEEVIGIDIRSNNGCAIGPPSTYKLHDGTYGRYEFLCMKSPQTCPDFLFDILKCDS